MTPEVAFLLEHAGWPALLVESSGVVRRTNSTAIAVLGPVLESNTALLSSIWDAGNESSAETFFSKWQRTQPPEARLKLRTKNGSPVEFVAFISSVNKDGQSYFLLQLFPPSSVARAPARAPVPGQAVEASLAHKQKLDCALQLTRTVALDFNNALTSILGHTSLVLRRMEHTHPWRNSLLEVEKSAEKAAEIAHDLAAFSLQEKDIKKQDPRNLNEVLRRTVELFKNSHPQLQWTLRLENKLYSANFDEAKIQQALIKIIDNAVQAAGNEGFILVQSINKALDEALKDGSAHISPGSYVCIEVIDSGPGIPSDVLPRVFEPFFTTKGSNHRGLGLAWAYGIVTNHGGSVAVTSKEGEGATVRIYLPALKGFVREVALEDKDLEGSQTILMIDDEDLLLTMGEMVLSSYGYKVLTANSGQKGLDLFTKHQAEIDLVITDLVMPRMSGRELIDHLRKLAPEVKVICSTGYLRARQEAGAEVYLQKPFTSQDLLRKVKEVLTP